MDDLDLRERGMSGAGRVTDLERLSKRPPLALAPPGAVSLAVGEPNFATPPEVVEAAVRALRDGHTHYSDQNGLPALRSAVAEGLPGPGGRSADHVLITHGATAGLAAVILAMIGPGDRVVIPEPAYSLYADLVTLAGGEVVFVPLDETFHWDLDRLAAALPGAAMVIFSNPANPTGIVHTEEELEALGRMLDGSGTLVVADEAYHSLIYPGYTFRSALEVESLRERTVYVQTFSKTFAMTGWRIGYIVGPPGVIGPAARVHRTTLGSLNTAVQLAALEALRLPRSAIEPMLVSYGQRREMVVEAMMHAAGVGFTPPEGAFYALLRYSVEVPSTTVTEELARRGVMVRAGSEFGPSGEGCIRISFAVSESNLQTGLERLVGYLA